nr:pXO2-52 [Bacillus anthracis]
MMDFQDIIFLMMDIKIEIYQDEKDMEKTEVAVKTEKTAIPFKWENPLEDTYTKMGYSESSPISAGGTFMG